MAVASLVLGSLTPAQAQGGDPGGDGAVVLDSILAVVGNRVILQSMVEEQIFIRFPQGQGLPSTPEGMAAVRRDILQDMIANELLLLEAERDTTLRATDEDIDAAVDEVTRNARQRYTSDQDFRRDLQQAGFQTPEEWRAWLRDDQRDRLLVDAMRSKLKQTGKLKTVTPTEAELRAFFDERKGAQRRPETISLRQIIVAPKAAIEAKAVAFAKADSIAKALRAEGGGGDAFAQAARRFSQDPGSKEQGGELGWFRRGVMDPAFERVAFGYRPGVISDPVETAFGYHVIQVQRIQTAEVQARHILIMPEIGPEQVDSARRAAEGIRAMLANGASFDSLQVRYHDPAESKELQRFPIDRLPEAYRNAINGVAAGGVSPVFELKGPAGTNSKFGVVRVVAREPAGEVTFDDAKEALRPRLEEIMTMQRHLDELKRTTFVDVRMP